MVELHIKLLLLTALVDEFSDPMSHKSLTVSMKRNIVAFRDQWLLKMYSACADALQMANSNTELSGRFIALMIRILQFDFNGSYSNLID